jgi:Tfp pilus assembly protein FimV
VVHIVQTFVEHTFDMMEEERNMSAATLSPRLYPQPAPRRSPQLSVRPVSRLSTRPVPERAARLSAASAGPALRLTARGRWVMRSVALVVAATALLTGGRAVAEGAGTPVPVDTYTVGSGETLWSIAAGFAVPGEDVRVVVDEITALNGMAGSALTAGDQILVPVER